MAENIKFKDSDILKNMEYLNDYESIVYGTTDSNRCQQITHNL